MKIRYQRLCHHRIRTDRETIDSIQAATPSERKTMKQSKFPPGWDEKRVREVLAHYETQTEEEAVAEDEAAFEDSSQTFVEIPNQLLPKVREMIAKLAS